MKRLILSLATLALTVACGDLATEPRSPTAPVIDVFEVQFERIGADSARFTVYVEATDPDGPDDKVKAYLYPGTLYGEMDPAYEIPWSLGKGFIPYTESVVAALPDAQAEIVQQLRVQNQDGLWTRDKLFLTIPPKG